MPDAAEFRVGRLNLLAQRGMIRLMKPPDAIFHFGNAELAIVNGLATGAPPNQAAAKACFLAGLHYTRPGPGEHVDVDIVDLAVGVDVGARKIGRQ